jgi:hypothetical protein
MPKLINDVLFEAELSSLTRKCRINIDHEYPNRNDEAYQPPHYYLPVATPQNVSRDASSENGPAAFYYSSFEYDMN